MRLAPLMSAIVQRLEALDRALLRVSVRWRALAYALTLAVMAGTGVSRVPRQYADFTGLPIVGGMQRHATYGNDTIGDGYTARTVLNDWRDMYTKTQIQQTPLEAATWTREASAPYPPAMLLAEASLYAIGARLGIGFYGAILAVAVVFTAASAVYFLRTRWYLFPALYLNFAYFGERFFYVQECSYLVMLMPLVAALYLARRGNDACHALVALATAMKLSPLYYALNVGSMRRRDAAIFIAILVGGLVVPYFILENYLYIYRYGAELKGDWGNGAAALAVVIPFAIVLRYVEARLRFDREDRIGWGLVPFPLLLALKMNVARHLLIVLLVPDKRGIRNIAAAVGLAVPAIFPVPFNSSLPFTVLVLVSGLGYYLRRIGWTQLRDDLKNPARTLREMAWPNRAAGSV